jgi:hypothetical protein
MVNTLTCSCGYQADTMEQLDSHITYMITVVGETFAQHH